MGMQKKKKIGCKTNSYLTAMLVLNFSLLCCLKCYSQRSFRHKLAGQKTLFLIHLCNTLNLTMTDKWCDNDDSACLLTCICTAKDRNPPPPPNQTNTEHSALILKCLKEGEFLGFDIVLSQIGCNVCCSDLVEGRPVTYL